MEQVHQAAILDVLRHQQLLLFSVVVSCQWKNIRVPQPAQPPHMVVEFLAPNCFHFFESFYHHRLPSQQHCLIGGPKAAPTQHLRRRS